MREIIPTILIYSVIKLFLLGLGIAVGFLLHWLIPAIEIGTGILIGVVATGMAIHFFGRVTSLAANYDADPDLGDEPKIVIVSDTIGSLRSGRKRRHKAT